MTWIELMDRLGQMTLVGFCYWGFMRDLKHRRNAKTFGKEKLEIKRIQAETKKFLAEKGHRW